MEKVTFKVVAKIKKLPKNATAPEAETVRQQGKFKITMEGTFSADQTDILALLLRSWSQQK